MALKYISIRGAREHNLKNISIDIPRDQFVVITGLSGSGKSSLAFDTLYAEGQRRYVESLSTYARQFLQLAQKPDVDSIEGLSPAISIEQKTTSKNPRSTVGTITEIYDYLRLFFARVGVPHSPATGLPIESQTISQVVDRIKEHPPKTRFLLLAPLVQGRKGEYKKEFLDLQKKGFQRVKVDGTLYEIENVPPLNKKLKHDIFVVVDRLVIPEKDRGEENLKEWDIRLADSLETAFKIGHDVVFLEQVESKETYIFSSKFSCPISGFTLEEIEPRLFSFNNPQGACGKCDGLGVEVVFDEELIVPDKTLTLRDGAIRPWSEELMSNKHRSHLYYAQLLDSVVRYYGGSSTQSFQDIPLKARQAILYGTKGETIDITYNDGKKNYITKKPFEGVIPYLKRRWLETESNWMRESLSIFQNEHPCSVCSGKRLNEKALCVKIKDKNIAEITSFSIKEASEWFSRLTLPEKQQTIAERILKEIQDRLKFLLDVGLNYLTLSRSAGTLSGGESQRIRLASQIGAGLTGVLYVLDEPSIGLHQRDNDRLLSTLKHLRDLGNTLVVVEHDEDAIRHADYIVDMGPRAGVHGGDIVAKGTLEEILTVKESLTAGYLTGDLAISLPEKRREGTKFLKLIEATSNNLKKVSASFPLGTLTCVTGVSGGGKSTLVIETLYKALARVFYKSREVSGAYKQLEGLEYIDKIIDIDQSPIGRTPRSNPATYIGCFTPIREWFAKLPESLARGYAPGRFSFNVKGGRCEGCQGDGVIKIEMHFLTDVYVKCDQCKGKRYNRETLDIHFNGKNIADVLDMSVDEAVEFFAHHPQVFEKLKTLQKVGMGYIQVGQQATTLSGGEAQRIKLAKELSRRSTGRTVYILDEPTTGLHFDDVKKLLEVLQALVDQGNTVIVIEHNLEVIKVADWIIDMGPEGGDGGGMIVATGTPEDICKVKESYTGHYLRKILES